MTERELALHCYDQINKAYDCLSDRVKLTTHRETYIAQTVRKLMTKVLLESKMMGGKMSDELVHKLVQEKIVPETGK